MELGVSAAGWRLSALTSWPTNTTHTLTRGCPSPAKPNGTFHPGVRFSPRTRATDTKKRRRRWFCLGQTYKSALSGTRDARYSFPLCPDLLSERMDCPPPLSLPAYDRLSLLQGERGIRKESWVRGREVIEWCAVADVSDGRRRDGVMEQQEEGGGRKEWFSAVLHSPLFLSLPRCFHVSTPGQIRPLPQMLLSVCAALYRMCPSHPHRCSSILV